MANDVGHVPGNRDVSVRLDEPLNRLTTARPARPVCAMVYLMLSGSLVVNSSATTTSPELLSVELLIESAIFVGRALDRVLSFC